MRKKIREEKDQEGGMAKVEIDSIERSVKNLKKKITNSDQQLPAWVQSKITRAADYINSASQYLMSGEELDEGAPAPYNHEIVKPNSDRNRLAGLTDAQLEANRGIKQADEERARRKAQREAAQKKGPQLPPVKKEELSLADKILEEMGCGCDKMKSHKTPEQISKKHKVPVEEVLKQLKVGTKVEFEHTNSKKEAEAIALQHLNERPDYYIRLKKAETANENVTVTDMFGNPTYEFIDLIKPDPIVSEANGKKMKGKDPCWKGYEMVGKKMKGEREVPNCVPVNEYLNPVQQFQNVPPVSNRTKQLDTQIQKLNLQKEKERKKIIQGQRRGNLPYSGATGLPTMEEEVIPMKSGQVMFVTVLWRGKYLGIQMFFPQTRIPNRGDVQDAVSKVYPDARLVTYKIGNLKQDMPLIQIQNSPSKNYKLNSGIIGEECIEEEGPSLSVGRGEKLSVEAGGGLTKKGRERYNRATGSNLKAPVTGKVKIGSKAWKRRKNFCSRSRSWTGPRGKAARRRWKCNEESAQQMFDRTAGKQHKGKYEVMVTRQPGSKHIQATLHDPITKAQINFAKPGYSAESESNKNTASLDGSSERISRHSKEGATDKMKEWRKHLDRLDKVVKDVHSMPDPDHDHQPTNTPRRNKATAVRMGRAHNKYVKSLHKAGDKIINDIKKGK